jgi:ADP-ribose pyrophosphatase YjhB (NUDIX family)
LDYRRTLVQVVVVANEQILVRTVDEGEPARVLPAVELEEGETPEDGAERAAWEAGKLSVTITEAAGTEKKVHPYRQVITLVARPTGDVPSLPAGARWEPLHSKMLKNAIGVEMMNRILARKP